MQAALDGTNKVGLAVLAGTAATLAVVCADCIYGRCRRAALFSTIRTRSCVFSLRVVAGCADVDTDARIALVKNR